MIENSLGESIMTGKEAILSYLQDHHFFTTNDVVLASGCTKSRVSSAVGGMLRKGELISVRNKNGNVTYFSRLDLVSSEEDSVIEQCKSSLVMQRVLVVWGVLSPDILNVSDTRY